MSKARLIVRLGSATFFGVGLILAGQARGAGVPVPWVGSADYTAFGGDLVGPFDAYDFSAGGVVLVKRDAGAGPWAVGDTFSGYFQSFVTGHLDGHDEVSSPTLNATGTGPGYELTVVGELHQTLVAMAFGGVVWEVTGGTATLYADSSPDYSFGTDSGFTDEAAIMTGTVTPGTHTQFGITSPTSGSTTLKFDFGSYDHAVYSPDTIGGGTAEFALYAGVGVVPSVDGHVFVPLDGDVILGVDGSLRLTAVPVPPALWLLGSALVGMLAFARQSKRAGLKA